MDRLHFIIHMGGVIFITICWIVITIHDWWREKKDMQLAWEILKNDMPQL